MPFRDQDPEKSCDDSIDRKEVPGLDKIRSSGSATRHMPQLQSQEMIKLLITATNLSKLLSAPVPRAGTLSMLALRRHGHATHWSPVRTSRKRRLDTSVRIVLSEFLNEEERVKT